MYPFGAPAVKCSNCLFVTEIGVRTMTSHIVYLLHVFCCANIFDGKEVYAIEKVFYYLYACNKFEMALKSFIHLFKEYLCLRF
jgi:hypothetical protein